MKMLFREPLVHFILLGGALFAGDAAWERWQVKTDYQIHVSSEEMQRQAVIFASENRRQPSDEDLQALLFAHIEEQVLMREAQRLGLDENDTIIRRRLAQKMRFMIEDIGELTVPDDLRLSEWYKNNRDAFVRPERRSFDHIFFSPQSRADLEGDARALLQNGIGENWKTLGDAFILQRSFSARSQADITKDFGRNFVQTLFDQTLFAQTQGGWSAPIESAFGLHLVRINEITPQESPEFSTIRDAVEAEWLDQASREDNQRRLTALIEKYKIIVDE